MNITFIVLVAISWAISLTVRSPELNSAIWVQPHYEQRGRITSLNLLSVTLPEGAKRPL